MKKIIVLQTSGKNDSVDVVSVHLFDNIKNAEKFCHENTDKEPDKYWQYCEIIEEGKEYLPARYKNYLV